MISLTESKSNRILGAFFIVFAVVLLLVIIPTQIKHIPNAKPSPRFSRRPSPFCCLCWESPC